MFGVEPIPAHDSSPEAHWRAENQATEWTYWTFEASSEEFRASLISSLKSHPSSSLATLYTMGLIQSNWIYPWWGQRACTKTCFSCWRDLVGQIGCCLTQQRRICVGSEDNIITVYSAKVKVQGFDYGYLLTTWATNCSVRMNLHCIGFNTVLPWVILSRWHQ